MEVFDVRYNNEIVGRVTVKKEGLYYVLSCRCKPLDGILRLVLHRDDVTVPIGVCAPEGSGMGITRKLPTKRMGLPPWQFALSDGNGEVFVPLGGELPTAVLQNIENARFCNRNGKPGLRFDYLPER